MITIDDFKANTKEWLIDKLGNMSLDDALQTISDLYNELHRPKYPKTYEECCQIIGGVVTEIYLQYNVRPSYKFEENLRDLLESLRKLIICRNAYWKIAGEQMGLGKPWEPEWNHINRKFYCIYNSKNNIVKGDLYTHNKILAFPTIEMRDTFYENFKDLIEKCKELL